MTVLRILCTFYIRGAVLDDCSIHGSNFVTMIIPPVPRRAGWNNDEISVFYVKLGNGNQAAEVSSMD